MKTTTAPKPTDRRPKAQATTLEISPFTVTTEWVKVTIPIHKKDADFLDSRNQKVRDGIGDDVSLFVWRNTLRLEPIGFKYIVAKTGRGPYGKTRPISFSMERYKWESLEKSAALIDATPEECCRAAIVSRVSEIREFLKEQDKKGGAA